MRSRKQHYGILYPYIVFDCLLLESWVVIPNLVEHMFSLGTCELLHSRYALLIRAHLPTAGLIFAFDYSNEAETVLGIITPHCWTSRGVRNSVHTGYHIQ